MNTTAATGGSGPWALLRIAGIAMALLLGLASAPQAAQWSPAQLKDFPRSTLTIQRASGRDTLQVFIADTPARQSQGLMWIRDLPADHGMLFLLDAPRPMQMWMKNTYLPLDMVFFAPDGRIVQIVARTTPLSTDIIASDSAVGGVLEIRGGEAARLGLAVGDRLVHPRLEP